MNDISTSVSTLTDQARAAYRVLSNTDDEQRNQALIAAANHLRMMQEPLLVANNTDLQAAAEKRLSAPMMDRLKLDSARIEAMAKGLEAIAELPDPLADTGENWTRPNGLTIRKKPVPLGVIGVVYESRPNVTADAAGLCIKSGNAVLLRGGSESFYSSKAIAECMVKGLVEAELPEASVQLIPSVSRGWVNAMMQADSGLDVLIPRGGKGLTSLVQQESRIPTILHLDGNCHSYVHEKANIKQTATVIANAKMRRTGICGATESLVVDRSIAGQAIPALCDALTAAGCTEIRGDELAQAADSRITPAQDDDWGTEYLNSIISIKIVSELDEAIAHINQYSSHHTDAIFTEDDAAAAAFEQQVDSAIVMRNTSTQFADGGEFGMGAEIGISTGRLHARGPVGAGQLVTYKYVVTSDGAIRA